MFGEKWGPEHPNLEFKMVSQGAKVRAPGMPNDRTRAPKVRRSAPKITARIPRNTCTKQQKIKFRKTTSHRKGSASMGEATKPYFTLPVKSNFKITTGVNTDSWWHTQNRKLSISGSCVWNLCPTRFDGHMCSICWSHWKDEITMSACCCEAPDGGDHTNHTRK